MAGIKLYRNYLRRSLGPAWTALDVALFSNTEAGENLAEKVVCGELPGNAAERVLRESQLLRKKFPAAQFSGSRLKSAARALERAQVPLSGEKQRFARRGPPGRMEDRPA